MIDIEPLLAATAESPPCGPNLEYDAAYLEVGTLARGRPDQQFGDTVIAAEEPRWPEVATRAVTLLGRSKDLHLVSLLVRALVNIEGFGGLLPGLQLTHGLLERYWDDIHPRLDAEEGGDPTSRLNALAQMADPAVLLRELRDAPLARSRQHGQVLVRDIEILLGKLPPRSGAPALSQAQIESVLAAAALEDPGAVPKVAETTAAAKALAALLDAKVGAAKSPDFKPLIATLQNIGQIVRQPGASPADGTAAPGSGTAAPVQQPSGNIHSRQDALAMLDKIIAFIEHNEPTNPAPLLLKRGKRFMTMNFVDIVKEIAPDSMAKIDAVTGPRGGA